MRRHETVAEIQESQVPQVSRYYKSLIPVGQPLNLTTSASMDAMPCPEHIDQALLKVLTKEEALIIMSMRAQAKFQAAAEVGDPPPRASGPGSPAPRGRMAALGRRRRSCISGMHRT